MTDAPPETLDPALSHTRGEAQPALIEQTIGDNFDDTVRRFGDREALVDVAQGRRWTYAELRADVDRLARALLAVGVRTGDRVGIWAPNCSEWTLVQYATAKVGAILVNINPSYRSHELQYVLGQAGISTLISAESFKTSSYREMVDEVRGEVDGLERVVYIGTPDWDDLLAHADEVSESELAGIQAGLANTDPINIQYTSGTTGFPKGATLRATQDEKVTSLYGVPTMFIAEWNLPDFADYDLSTVRTGIMAGSPCPAELMKKLIASGIEEMTICYGMTETSPVSTQNRTDDTFEQKVGTVGRVGPHLEIKIADPVTGETLPRGKAGEFMTKGYSVMLGYWEQPDKTAEAIEDGWMHTGDIGVMHDDGYVEITGRIKDMVIRGGENVYPREIEEFLYTHPDILDAQVIGVPDEKYGEELCAWVRMKDGATPHTAESLREFCTGQLAHYKIPRYVEIVDEFPMTVTGKIRKVEMRETTAKKLGLG